MFRRAFCEQISLLGPNPIALCVGIVTIGAAFDATTPTHTRFGIDILSAIQPVVVSRALHGVYATGRSLARKGIALAWISPEWAETVT